MQTLAEIEAYYSDPRYWNGGLNGEGYVEKGYQDFAVNELKIRRVLEMHPVSVLSVGCGPGYDVKRLWEAGIPAHGADISDYALASAPEQVKPYLRKAWAWELPYPDKMFDVLVSFGMLEHIPPGYLERTLREFGRVASRGLLSITLETDPTGQKEPGHALLQPRAWWQAQVAKLNLSDRFEVWADSEQSWLGYYSNNILIIAPGIMPISQHVRYGGIERLCQLFVRGLKDTGLRPILIAPEGSTAPDGAILLEAGKPGADYSEPGLPPVVAQVMKQVLDAGGAHMGLRGIIDFAHSHPVRYFPWAASLNIIWHDPAIMQPPPPPTNVIALSRWQAERYRQYQGREARVLDPICFDASYYKPDPNVRREDRCLFVGKISLPDKGCLEAARTCRSLRQPLDIVGKIGPGEHPDYVKAVLAECDGQDIVYHGEVDDDAKLALLQRSKALLYPVSYPYGQGEAHSHKSTEAIACLPGNTRILCSDGWKPIAEVRVGDQVLGHKKVFAPVIQTFVRSYAGDLITIQLAMNHFGLKLTPNHLVYASHGRLGWSPIQGTGSPSENAGVMNMPEWVPAEELAAGDYLVFPIQSFDDAYGYRKRTSSCLPLPLPIPWHHNQFGAQFMHPRTRVLPAAIQLTPELMRFLGYYISDGSGSGGKGTCTFYFGASQEVYADDVANLAYTIWKVPAHIRREKNVLRVEIHNKQLEQLLTGWCGHNAVEKRIPLPLMRVRRILLGELLKGLWRGDGNMSKGNGVPTVLRYETISPNLVSQMVQALGRFHVFPQISERPNQQGFGASCARNLFHLQIQGEAARTLAPLLGIEEQYKQRNHNNAAFYQNGFMFIPIKEVKRSDYSGPVYNLAVGDQQSYTANLLTVHNCGCPVIANHQGAMPEVIEDGLTGYCVFSPTEMGEAIKQVETLDRDKCRARAVERWSVSATLGRWAPVIDEVIKGERW